MQSMIFEYIKDKHGNKKGIFVAGIVQRRLSNDLPITEIAIGYSLTKKPDVFNKAKGMEIAIGRAESSRVSKCPRSLEEKFFKFEKRCARYYKILK